MSEQMSLRLETPIRGRSRRHDVDSAKAAAKHVDADLERHQIIRALRAHPEGLTADEIDVRHNGQRVHRSQVASRLAQLRRMGDVDTFGFRLNERGLTVQVWVFRYPYGGVTDIAVANERL